MLQYQQNAFLRLFLESVVGCCLIIQIRLFLVTTTISVMITSFILLITAVIPFLLAIVMIIRFTPSSSHLVEVTYYPYL